MPAQYDGKAEVIYRRELPLMIAAFIDPGKFRADGKPNRQPEYDPDRHGIGGWRTPGRRI